jgi:two-component system OmpR family sensor kinase/two-component system sensor histidine kinase BaeS
LTQRVEVPGGGEAGDLANAFNQMAAELERGERLRKQMTADIAHELRTPLSVIQGNVEALQDGVFPLTKESLAPIQDKTILLSRLVEDLRNLAMADAGQLPLDRKPTDLAALASSTVAGFQPHAEIKSVDLVVEVEEPLPLANIDPQRIDQVLVNLVSNALRYTPSGGKVTIHLSSSDPKKVEVRVIDTGQGIPAEAFQNIFERFYRVDKSRARGVDGHGTGLGLAVVRSLVEAHGGQISIADSGSQGTTFLFTLPAA